MRLTGMNSSEHGVSLCNFDINNTITVTFPLLYLHGNIEVEKSSTNISCKNGDDEMQWPVKDGEFKLFVFLLEGSNSIRLKTSDETECTVIANYAKPLNPRYVLPVYVVCKNSEGEFMAPPGVPNTTHDAVEKIQLNARLMQTYFAESLYEHGFERKTFVYAEDEENHRPLVKIFHSELDLEKTKEMTRLELYDAFQRELIEACGEDLKRKLLVFMSCTRYSPPPGEILIDFDKIQSYTTGHAALGGGNMALFGNGSLHTWASHLEELNSKFTDHTMIDRTQLFDDSAGRGTYAANYATTLGATVHELGHAFDLAHTAHGIMRRGHDDMNYFYTVVKEDSEDDISRCRLSDDQPKYKGAHWYRSSAVILNYNKWFNPTFSEESNAGITKNLHPNMLGPVGNAGPSRQKDQVLFNSHAWAQANKTVLIGVVFYHDKYLYGIQFLGTKSTSTGQEKEELITPHAGGVCSFVCSAPRHKNANEEEKLVEEEVVEAASEIFGTSPSTAKKTVFYFNDPGEQIETIRVRSGAWIDGIDISTNKKCTEWLGGDGGGLSEWRIGANCPLLSIVGTAGECIGSLGILLNDKEATTPIEESAMSFSSDIGIRLLETYKDDGEVLHFQEYSEVPPPTTITLSANHLLANGDRGIDGLVYDCEGGKHLFSLHEDDRKFISAVAASISKTSQLIE